MNESTTTHTQSPVHIRTAEVGLDLFLFADRWGVDALVSAISTAAASLGRERAYQGDPEGAALARRIAEAMRSINSRDFDDDPNGDRSDYAREALS